MYQKPPSVFYNFDLQKKPNLKYCRHFKMNSYQSVISLFFFLLCISVSLTVELTFELPDNARECFYEEIESGTDFTVEFQVIGLLSYCIYNVTYHLMYRL